MQIKQNINIDIQLGGIYIYRKQEKYKLELSPSSHERENF